MSQEKVFSDFSGGMNALAEVDKLDPRECLLAENVRLDQAGSIQSAGAFTAQNTATYTDAIGESNIQSLYWNPALGAVAGVGEDVFTGPTLGGMTSKLVGANLMAQKMSFGSAYNRVYFDVSNVGYWTDMSNFLTVDWPPPVAVGATITTSNVGTGSQTGTNNVWTSPGNIVGTSTNTVAQSVLSTLNVFTNFLRATMTTNSFAVSTAAATGISISFNVVQTTNAAAAIHVYLLKNGLPVGTSHFATTMSGNANLVQSISVGGSTDLWGVTWSQAEINSGAFGFQIDMFSTQPPETIKAYNGKVTVYQGAGFVAGTSTVVFGGVNGTYVYKITFVDGQGEESDASNDSNAIVINGTAGTLTGIQVGDGRTTSRNVYREGGLLTSHYLVGSIGDNTTTTFLDNQSTDVQALATGIILAGDVPGDYPNTRFNNALMGAIGAPAGLGRFPTLHYDRIFWINPNKTNQIFWSKPLNGFAYPSVNFVNVGDGKPVTRLISIFGELIIIKTDSIWRLTGTDEASFNLTQTPSAVGTDEPFTVVALPDKVIFANRYGLWVFNGYTSVPLTTKLDTWFRQQNRTNVSLFGVEGFKPPEIVTAMATTFEAVGNSEKYYLTYAESGFSTNGAVLVFDVKHGNITKRTCGGVFKQSINSLAIDEVNGYVYAGLDGFVALVDDWQGSGQITFQHGVTPANFDYQHGYQDLERGSNKSLWALEFFMNTNGQTLTPSVYYDSGANSETLAPITTAGLQRVIRTVQATNARKVQNISWRLNGAINPVNISGMPQIEVVHVKALYDVRVGRARTGQ